LFGKGGIQVNGEPVRHAMLNPGDDLQVGDSSIWLRHVVEPEYGPQETEPHWDEEPAHEAPDEQVIPSEAVYDMTEESTYTSGPDEDVDAEACRETSAREPEEVHPAWESDAPSCADPQPQIADDEALTQLSGRERRKSCRYPVEDVDAMLSWWEPNVLASVVVSAPKNELNLSESEATMYSRVMARWPGNHNGSPASRAGAELARDPLPATEESVRARKSIAQLLDISQTGMLILSDAAPPDGQRLWLRLESPQVTDWVEVVVKGASPETDGVHRVRLAFQETCPYDFFKAALYRKRDS
jgi:hypothetical protein